MARIREFKEKTVKFLMSYPSGRNAESDKHKEYVIENHESSI